MKTDSIINISNCHILTQDIDKNGVHVKTVWNIFFYYMKIFILLLYLYFGFTKIIQND